MPTPKRRVPQQCVGVAGVAAWLDVAPSTVTQWFIRYGAAALPAADFDAPARYGDTQRFWLDTPERRQEWAGWQASRLGQGRPGQPKPRRAKETGNATTA